MYYLPLPSVQEWFSKTHLARYVVDEWTASIIMAGLTTFILAGWTGMNVAV
jgi:hypothetical protein